jgi:hypothetical protein
MVLTTRSCATGAGHVLGDRPQIVGALLSCRSRLALSIDFGASTVHDRPARHASVTSLVVRRVDAAVQLDLMPFIENA